MSTRNIRKLYGDKSLPPPEGSSDEEYEPLYAKSSPSKFKYDGLLISSHSSESEHESTDAVGMEDVQVETISKKKKKKKRKQRKAKLTTKSSSMENFEELDEIDKSVMEVNAILGVPPPAPSVSAPPPVDPKVDLLTVQAKHLNPNNELERLFGPEESEVKRRGRQPDMHRLLRKAIIVPITDAVNYQKSGLSMSILRRESGFTYFVFDHSKEYQRIHREFLKLQHYRAGNLTMSIEDAQRNMHVEAMIESADSMFRVDAHAVANTLIEQSIAYMQHVAHPSFNPSFQSVRLEYNITENRPFHIAIMKYMYLLTNRACHRTALELAKMLLNLDPTDPLAVLFIVDTLALRAREHQWFIHAFDYWSKERDAGFLFNMQYSYAMAHFHVALKNKDDLSKADELLRAAMLRFPSVALRILENANAVISARVRACTLFSTADEQTGKNLKDLIALHAKFVWSKWREPAVFEWLVRNVDELAVKYDVDKAMQERAKELANERLNLFRGWPEEVVRHLSVIKPMSNLIVDGAVPHVNRCRSANPVPPSNGTSRYGYDRVNDTAATTTTGSSPLYELFTSVLPHYGLPPLPQELQRRMIEGLEREAGLAQALAGVQEGQIDEIVAGAVAGAVAVAEYETLTDEDDDHDDGDENDDAARDEAYAAAAIAFATAAAVARAAASATDNDTNGREDTIGRDNTIGDVDMIGSDDTMDRDHELPPTELVSNVGNLSYIISRLMDTSAPTMTSDSEPEPETDHN